MQDNLSQFIPIADAIAKIFKPHVEVVIHDIKTDSIAFIENAYSGRRVGDPSLLGSLEDISEGFPREINVIGPYENAGNKGQRIRSISAVLKDSKGEAAGILCINVDFSVMEASLEILEAFLKPHNIDAPPKVLFQNDWRDTIKLEIRSYLLEHNKDIDNINSGTRKDIIRRLEDKGLFYARKSVEQLAGILGISRATAYNDLKLIRKEKNSKTTSLN